MALDKKLCIIARAADTIPIRGNPHLACGGASCFGCVLKRDAVFSVFVNACLLMRVTAGEAIAHPMALIARVCILIIADSIESKAARAIRGVVNELAGRRGRRRGWIRGRGCWASISAIR